MNANRYSTSGLDRPSPRPRPRRRDRSALAPWRPSPHPLDARLAAVEADLAAILAGARS